MRSLPLDREPTSSKLDPGPLGRRRVCACTWYRPSPPWIRQAVAAGSPAEQVNEQIVNKTIPTNRFWSFIPENCFLVKLAKSKRQSSKSKSPRPRPGGLRTSAVCRNRCTKTFVESRLSRAQKPRRRNALLPWQYSVRVRHLCFWFMNLVRISYFRLYNSPGAEYLHASIHRNLRTVEAFRRSQPPPSAKQLTLRLRTKRRMLTAIIQVGRIDGTRYPTIAVEPRRLDHADSIDTNREVEHDAHPTLSNGPI